MVMNLRVWLALCLGLMCGRLLADDIADRLEIAGRAREMINATFRGDVDAVLKFTHPAVVKISGGEEPLKKAVEGVKAQAKQLGLEFVSMDVEPPEKLFGSGGETFAVVKSKTVMQIPGKTRVTETGSMIAIRATPGGTWTFLRVSAPLAGNRALLKSMLPNLPDEMTIEAPGKPFVVPLTK